ncbi:shikimate kinase [Cryobacterium sp. Y11]|jgi:shikimate kinase|uniref:shikimate kinase n=1 Tax=Cryobacterium sp. Y11 TaxID=2045016 RepID=UPI001E2B43A9|nr:shikimate kinase [Cryobacterium sp. Y11]
MLTLHNTMLPIVFIGPMAAGKTRIGRRVARDLNLPFIDTDKRIVESYGPISEIFAREGEEYFRIIEREAVDGALGEPAVISLGGGAVLHAETQADLESVTVIYLSVTRAAVEARLGGNKRPLLAGGITDWERIYNLRRPTYEALATIRLDTSNRPITGIADEIVNWVQERNDD